MNENLEMKIYELLGIKLFKKVVFIFRDIFCTPLFLDVPKEKRHEAMNQCATNYNIGSHLNFENIKKFRKKLYMNATIHTVGLLLCLAFMVSHIISGSTILTIAFFSFFSVLNLYCVMLQRYNIIRINRVLEKMTPKYEEKKNKVKEEIKEYDSYILEHSYKIINARRKEFNIQLDDLVNTDSLEKLKAYREALKYFQYRCDLAKDDILPVHSIITPIDDKKSLKLELK